MVEDLTGYIAATDAAKNLGVALSTIHRWRKLKWIEGKDVYGRIYVKESDLASANERSLIVSSRRRKEK